MDTFWTMAFVVAGLVSGGAGGVTWVRDRRFRGRALRVSGVVVDLRASGGSPQTMYRPVFRFRTYEGRDMRGQSNMASNPPPARLGEQITVMYDPRNPVDARIDKFGHRGKGVALILLGFVFLVAGIALAAGVGHSV